MLTDPAPKETTGRPTGATNDGARPGLASSARLALRSWTRRQWGAALAATAGIGLVIGLSTVLIPNRVFGRQIASVAWNYPVWVIVSVLSGMLAATYVRPSATDPSVSSASMPDAATAEAANGDASQERPARFGAAGAVLGWFAVGCPVCNKIALLALGYSGALRWFAPAQPFLAAVAMALSAWALLTRLRGQVWCPVPAAVHTSH